MAETTDEEIKKYLKQIARQGQRRHIVMRGILNGIFTAIGATIGFALFLLIAGNIVSGLNEIPLVDKFLTQTKLDVVIDNALEQISEQQAEENDGANGAIDNNSYSRYTSSDLGISFIYPNSLNQIQHEGIDSQTKITFEGSGEISSLSITKGEAKFSSDEVIQQFVNNSDFGEVEVYISSNEASDEISYFAELRSEDNIYSLEATDGANPSVSRDIFFSIVRSVELI